jgi:hypothetical protein
MKKGLGIVITLALIGGMIFLRVRGSYNGFNYQSSNFAFFWLSGRMLIEGENPYNEAQYTAGHETYGIQWMPNKIFPYPLPLAIFCIPLGMLSLPVAYLTWQVITLLIIALTIFALLHQWEGAAQRRLLVPVFAAILYFGPVYLTLHTGSIGAFALLAILGSILLLKKDHSLFAGILLSLTILKPPQGVTILFLAGIWFLARRDWKAILGIVIGGITLLVIGMIQDPLWVVKFRGASEAVMDRTQGVQSNVWSVAYLACNGNSPCWPLLGATLSLILLGVAGFSLWRNQPKWSEWEAMNLIIPIGFISTIYLWAYDQILYIIPIVWIIGTLVQRTKSYIHAFIFLIVVDLISFYALAQQATADKKDLWSFATTAIILCVVLGLRYWRNENPNSRNVQT